MELHGYGRNLGLGDGKIRANWQANLSKVCYKSLSPARYTSKQECYFIVMPPNHRMLSGYRKPYII